MLRVAGIAAVAGIALFCVALLAVRFVVFPRVAEHRDAIASMLANELGQPVEIDAIRTGWDGWNPQLAIAGLRVRDRARPDDPPFIDVAQIRGVVSWTSMLFADLRLRELTIDRPRLGLTRDSDGRLHVSGVTMDASAPGGEARHLRWLMRQPLVVVRDALVFWDDESRNAPQLLLDGVRLRLENRFSQHRFGLAATPPPEVAGPIDLRGEFDTAFLADWRKGRGRMYLRLDHADIAALAEWLPIPVAVSRGKGALRAWFEFDHGVVRDAVADVEAADVRAQFANDLAPLDLAHLAGRLTFQHTDLRRTWSAQGLRFTAPNGTRVASTNLNVRYELDATGAATSGQLAFNQIDFAPLGSLAAHLPLPTHVRGDLARYAPQGSISAADYAWQGPFGTPTAFTTRGSFANVGIRTREPMPGLRGLSGSFQASESAGSLELRSSKVMLTMPKVFADPVALDTANGRVRWERRADHGVTVRLDEVQFANAHVAGTTRGSWKSVAGGPGEVDLTARITRSDARELHRYMPLVVSEKTRHWVRDSIPAIRADEARLTLKGNLARFPFPDGKSGTFLVTLKASDATLDYAHGWPPVTRLNADIRFEGNGLSIAATHGSMLGVTLGPTLATISDLSIDHPILTIVGEAAGPTPQFLRFIDTSPLADWTDRFTQGAEASGEGRLMLELAMALGKPDDIARVNGTYQFSKNALALPGVPPLTNAGGKLVFTERELNGHDLTFATLGGSGQASLTSRNGTIDVHGSGSADLAHVRTAFDLPWGQQVSGTTDWRLEVAARKSSARWTLQSSLRGAELDLPQPLGKRAFETVNLGIEVRPGSRAEAGRVVVVEYGRIGRAVAQLHPESAGGGIERALVLFGQAAAAKGAMPDRPGITLRGDVGSVDIDEWLALSGRVAQGAQGATHGLALDNVDIDAREFVAFGRRYDAMKFSARHAASNWRLRFAAQQGEGTAVWEPAGSRHANGRLSAQLARLDTTKFDSVRRPGEPSREETLRREGSANPWPELDVVAERFIGKAGNLGRMELAARPEGTDWHVTRLALVNDAGRVDANGWWRLVGGEQHTRLDVRMDVKDAGAWLQKVGMPDGVKGAPARLDGQLAWRGSPADFEYARLSGDFEVKVGAGQFTKLDPGVGKLLGVLSLQAFPRRINLDFRDVFSDGFAFDSMTGKVGIANGILRTDDLMLAGPAAKVHLAGDVDLAHETQRLSVRVQPSLATTVSAGAGAAAIVLLAANPLVGAAVGAGTLLAQKIMQDPIEHLFSYEYAVTGSWSEPLVERMASGAVQRLGDALKGDGAAR